MSKKLTISLVIPLIFVAVFLRFGHNLTWNVYLNWQIQKCITQNNQLCWVDLVTQVFKKQGLESALDFVSEVYEKNPSFSSVCHDVGHLLGSGTYKLFKEGKEFKITPNASFCSYGFYHGFMETMVSSEADLTKAREFCLYVDTQVSALTPDAALQCFHGIGHGWVNVHDDKKLWGDDQGIVNKGLKLCELVSATDSELSRCATGVFNGLSAFYSTGEYQIKLNRDDPLWICGAQESKYQDPCYISMNSLLLSISNGNLKDASKYVEDIKDDEIAKHTMLNLAIPYGLNNINESDHQTGIDTCRGVQSRLVTPCLQGYAFAFLEHGIPGEEYVKSLSFCKSSGLTESEKSDCLGYIYTYLAQWYAKDKATEICNREDNYQEYCHQRLTIGLEGLKQ